jgi:hypothetical protein
MVRFSELAEADLTSVTEDAEQRAALRHSIILHLSHVDATEKSHKLPEPASRLLYMFAMWKVRITWEVPAADHVMVWSVSLLRAYR